MNYTNAGGIHHMFSHVKDLTARMQKMDWCLQGLGRVMEDGERCPIDTGVSLDGGGGTSSKPSSIVR